MLDSRIHLTRLWLCSASATAHHCTSVPATLNSPGVDSYANEHEVQKYDKQATLCPLSRICFTASDFCFLVNPSLNRWSCKLLTFALISQESIPRFLTGIYKREFVKEMFQGWTSSSTPNIFPDMLTACFAMQENLYLGSMSSVRMGLTVLLQTSALNNLPF